MTSETLQAANGTIRV